MADDDAPTEAQLKYIADKAKEYGAGVPEVKTRKEASDAIQDLIKDEPKTPKQVEALTKLAKSLGHDPMEIQQQNQSKVEASKKIDQLIFESKERQKS